MTSRTHLVVTCTASKRAASAVSVASLDAPTVGGWLALLDAQEHTETLPARDLYQGALFTASLAVVEAISGESELYIASAGLGLLHGDQVVPGYDASFSPGSVDVAGGAPDRAEALSRWWLELARSSRFSTGSISDLVARHPSDRVVVVASAAYVAALRDDLVAAHRAAPENLTLISVGADQDRLLGRFAPAFDARAQGAGRPIPGGARVSLNPLVAQHLLTMTHGDASLAALTSAAAEMMMGLGAVPTYDRTPLADEAVADAIERMRRDDPSLSRTRALRRLRDRGMACEQGRFRDIWDAVTSTASQPTLQEVGS